MEYNLKIKTSNKQVNNSIEISYNDISMNIKKCKNIFLGEEYDVFFAGVDYDRPWTRDASINVYNACGFMNKNISYHTLMSVLEEKHGDLYIGGQYWDSIIWALGAYQYYLINRDVEFLKNAYMAIKNTMKLHEKNEFSDDYGLFRGPAVYGDGGSAYPYTYGYMGNNGSILDYPKMNKEKCYDKGYGIPMHTLSTNAIYCIAYDILIKMSEKLESKDNEHFLKKKDDLLKAIKYHYIYDTNKLKYIVGKFGDSLRQEGLGIAFASMANAIDTNAFEHIYVSKNGIPCVYPTFERYHIDHHYGRHSGTIWPHVQCFFAIEALRNNKDEMFDFEFNKLTEFSNRDNQFYEIFHPETGEAYGGLQEHYSTNTLKETKPAQHQTWSATGYLSLLLYGFAGISITEEKISFNPYLNEDVSYIDIDNIEIAKMNIHLKVSGIGKKIASITINNMKSEKNYISIDLVGEINIDIKMEKNNTDH